MDMEVQPQQTQEDVTLSEIGTVGKRSRIVVGVLLITVASIVAMVFALVRYYPPASEMWRTLTLPSELQSARFLSTEGSATTAYRWGVWHFIPDQSGVIAFDAIDGTNTSIRKGTDGSYGIWVGEKQQTSSFAPKKSISISPDGHMVAYAELWSPAVSTTTSPATGTDADRWRVVLFDLNTKDITVLGQGVLPFFTSNDRVLRFSLTGILETNIRTRTERVVNPFPVTSSFTTAAQSMNRNTIAWSDLNTGTVTVARMNDGSLEILHRYGSLKTPLYAISNTALYSIVPTATGTSLLKYRLDSDTPKHMYIFPRNLPVIDISL